jgi:hypothetical protein
MNLVSLLAIAASLAAFGAFITITLVRRIPLELLERSQQHGRFAHLGEQDQRSGPARVVRVESRTPARSGSFHPA